MLSVFALSSYAQNTRLEISELGVFSNGSNEKAKVYLNQDEKLKEIIIQKAKSRKTIKKWRVRIYMGSDRNSRATATSTRNAFVARYPEIKADIVYPSPNFKVYVGNYDTRLEAESFRKKIQKEYPKSRVELVILESD